MSWIAAAGAVAGGLLSKPKTNANKQLKFEEDRLRRLQKKFGISPLAALGTSGPMLSTQVGSDYGIAEAARLIDDGISADKAEAQRQKELATAQQLNQMGQAQSVRESVARVTKDEAIADYYNTLANQNRAHALAVPKTPGPTKQDGPLAGQVEVKADEVVSPRVGNPSVTAGSHAGWIEHVVTPSGGKLRMPYTQEGMHENMESMFNPFYAVPVIRASVKAYGAQAVANTLSELYGGPPGIYNFLLSKTDGGSFDELVSLVDKAAARMKAGRSDGFWPSNPGGASGRW